LRPVQQSRADNDSGQNFPRHGRLFKTFKHLRHHLGGGKHQKKRGQKGKQGMMQIIYPESTFILHWQISQPE
jgi:hypothetical protein